MLLRVGGLFLSTPVGFDCGKSWYQVWYAWAQHTALRNVLVRGSSEDRWGARRLASIVQRQGAASVVCCLVGV